MAGSFEAAGRYIAKDGVRIGVFLPTWIGDACMATPTLQAIRKGFKQAKIVAITRPVVRELLSDPSRDHGPFFDESICYQKSLRGRLQLARELRRDKFDFAILLTNSFWSAAAMRLGGVRNLAGYSRDGRGWMLNPSVAVPKGAEGPKPISAIDYYQAIAHAVGCSAESKQMHLGLNTQCESACDELWRRAEFDPATPTVVINSNAATDSARVWPASKVKQLALSLANECNVQVLLHCDPRERAVANAVAEEANHRMVRSMGIVDSLPIGLSKSVLARASTVVTTDSGARHMAVALNRKVVTLFGPTNEIWTRTYNLPERVITPELSGDNADSPQNIMQHISVDTVFAAAKDCLYTHQAAA